MLISEKIKESLIREGGIALKVPRSVALWAIKMPYKEVNPSRLDMLRYYIRQAFTFNDYAKKLLRSHKPRHQWVVHTYIMQNESGILCTTKEVNPDGSEIKPELCFGTMMAATTTGIPAGKYDTLPLS